VLSIIAFHSSAANKKWRQNMKSLILFFSLIISNTIWATINTSNLTEDERNNINIFQEGVGSVVFVSTIQKGNHGWYYGDQEIPAGAGSGFVWDENGHIVTNMHVVENGNKFQISFHNDKEIYEAELVGKEPKKDIAVLKLINRPKKLRAIKIGNSKELLVGQKAVAIGNPFGLDHTMTRGIISALDRKIDGFGGVKIHGMIQTDASINPGNSGGPLLNSQAQLIGMNTMIYSNSGSSAGIGFAVPVEVIKSVVPQLIQFGKVIRPGLGIGILPDHVKRRFGIEKGVVISYMDRGGAASKAGLEGMGQDRWGRIVLGDIILSIDDKKTESYDDLVNMLEQYKIGDSVKVEYLRNGKKITTSIKLTEI
jgi:S1-C subfamily serine protease